MNILHSQSPHIMSIKYIDCKFQLNTSYITDISEIKLHDVSHKNIRFKNETEYIKYIIRKIKHRIIKNLPDLNLVSFHMDVYDKNNIIHGLTLRVSNMLCELLKLDKMMIMTNKQIFLTIYYDGKFVSCGNISF